MGNQCEHILLSTMTLARALFCCVYKVDAFRDKVEFDIVLWGPSLLNDLLFIYVPGMKNVSILSVSICKPKSIFCVDFWWHSVMCWIKTKNWDFNILCKENFQNIPTLKSQKTSVFQPLTSTAPCIAGHNPQKLLKQKIGEEIERWSWFYPHNPLATRKDCEWVFKWIWK